MSSVWQRQKGGGTSQSLEAKGVEPSRSQLLSPASSWVAANKQALLCPHPPPYSPCPHPSPFPMCREATSRTSVIWLRSPGIPLPEGSSETHSEQIQSLTTQSFIPISLPALPGVQGRQCPTTSEVLQRTQHVCQRKIET